MMSPSRTFIASAFTLFAIGSQARAEHWIPDAHHGAKINYIIVGSAPDQWGGLSPFLKVSLSDTAAASKPREYGYQYYSDADLNAMAELLTKAKDGGVPVMLEVDDDADVFRTVLFSSSGPTALSAGPAATRVPGDGIRFDLLGKKAVPDRARVPLFGRAAPETR